MQQPINNPNPRWWNDRHDQAWNRAREDVRRVHMKNGKSDDDWRTVEPAARYGFCAASQYSSEEGWTDNLETKLREEWNDLKTGKPWDHAKPTIKRGWEAARGKSQRPS